MGTQAPARFRREDLGHLGRFLREQREEAGLTLRGLADRSGVSPGTIRAIESGRSNPSLGTMLAIIEALGLSVDRMLEAVRARKSGAAVVTRAAPQDRPGDRDLSDGLAGAVLAAQVLALPAQSLRRLGDAAARHAAFGMVTRGTVLATLATGARVRLETGDCYLARPGRVQALAGGGGETSRVLLVLDRRVERGGAAG